MIRFNMLVAVTLLFLQLGLYAENYALFLHGFGGDKNSWQSSGTIDELMEEGVIHGYLNEEYDESLVGDQNYIYNKFIAPMSNMSTPQDRWVIIGHSMGGLLARSLELQLQQINSLNVAGVLTIGTPHQGARVAHASLNSDVSQSGYGYYNPGITMLDWKDKINEAFKFRSDVIDFFVALQDLQNLTAAFVTGQYTCQSCELDNLGGYLDDAWTFAEDYIRLADEANAMSLIGTNGSIIADINSYETTAPYRSVMGAEIHPIPIRFGSTFSEVLKDSDENDIYESYLGLKSYMSANWHWYHDKYVVLQSLAYFNFGATYFEAQYNKKIRNKWGKAREAWDNIDDYWGQAINSYEVTTSYMTSYRLQCNDIYGYWDGGDRGELDPDWDIYFREDACTGNWDNDWTEVRNSYYIYTADKSDGLIRPKEARWLQSDNWITDDQNSMYVQNNYYYSDAEITEPGYNHNELRDYIRKYSPRLGEQSVPWQDIQIWLKSEVFN